MHQRSQGGYVLVTTLIALSVLLTAGLAALSQSGSSLRTAAAAHRQEQALYAANAGIEHGLAHLQQTGMVTQPVSLQHVYSQGVAPSEYRVSITPHGVDVLVRSEGRVKEQVRTVEATVGLRIPPAYFSPFFSTQGINFSNNLDVCGDILTGGDLSLSNGVTVWRNGAPGSPCDRSGNGSVVAGGRLIRFPNTVIQGEWCDSTNWGHSRLCPTRPGGLTLPPPDFAHLRQTASRWFVTDPAFCAGRGPSCVVVSPGFVLQVTGASHPGITFVEGSIQIGGLAIQNLATYAATQEIRFSGSAVLISTCAPQRCSAGYVAGGAIQVQSNNLEIHGALISTDTALGITWKNNVTVRGSLMAPVITSGNNGLLYAMNPHIVGISPGLPGVDEKGGVQIMGWREVR